MATCEAGLWKLVKKIEPAQGQKEGATKSHTYLRDILCTGQMASRIVGHYLSGSYSRDTAIRPIDDVDIIFVIDPSKWPRSALNAFLFPRPSPETVLNSFANAIRYRYPVSSVYGQRRSVRLQLYHLDIDVVPAIILNSQGELILIPDKTSGNWIKSSPKRHSKNATDVNKRRDGKFKPLVKLLKLWNNNLPSTAKLKSFAIETMAVRLFRKTHFKSLEKGLLYFFDFVSSFSGQSTIYKWTDKFEIDLGWWETTIPDAAGTDSNTAAKVDNERRKRFLEKATISRNKMVEADKAYSSDTACKRVSEALRV